MGRRACLDPSPSPNVHPSPGSTSMPNLVQRSLSSVTKPAVRSTPHDEHVGHLWHRLLAILSLRPRDRVEDGRQLPERFGHGSGNHTRDLSD